VIEPADASIRQDEFCAAVTLQRRNTPQHDNRAHAKPRVASPRETTQRHYRATALRSSTAPHDV
jgi:hypothetical protein